MNKVQKTTNKGQLATVDASVFQMEKVSGFEEVTGMGDLALPFLRVLSQLSAQCNKTSNGYVEGSEPGMIYNTVSKQLSDGEKGVDVIPCYYKKEYVEWDASQQGKLIAVHPSDFDLTQTERDANYILRMKDSGNVIKETVQYYVIALGDDGPSQAVISMAGTQLKASKGWLSMMMGIRMHGKDGAFNPPMFSHVYTLTTVPQSNAKGTWFGWSIAKKETIKDASIYEEARKFAEAASQIKVSHEEHVQASTAKSY